MFDRVCNTCVFAQWDYEEYYGGAKRWYFDECSIGLDGNGEDCEGYKEYMEGEN